MITAFLCSGQVQMLAKKIEQSYARINREASRLAIDLQVERNRTGRGFMSCFDECCACASQWFGQVGSSRNHAYGCNESPPGQVGIYPGIVSCADSLI